MKQGQGKKLAAASAAMMIAEPALALAHTGGTGVIVGLAVGALAYLVADEVHQARSGSEQEEEQVTPEMERSAPPGKRSLAYRLLNGKSVRGESDATSSTPGGLPRRSPTFAEMKHLIKPGRDILGFDGQKFITGVSFSQSVNIAIIGMPRHGKTTCLRFHLAQGLLHNAIIRGWDTHGDVAGEFSDYLSIAETVPDILADCEWIEQELERRNALYKRVRAHDQQAISEWSQLREILYIVDEFMVLSGIKIKDKGERATVTNTLLSLIAEGSKYKVRVILSGQAMPANLFGNGASSVRDIISTKYAFASEDRQAQMIGIEQKAIEELMPMIAGDDIQGYAILAGGPLRNNVLVSTPDTTFEDIQALLNKREDSTDMYEDESDLVDALPEGITEFDLEQIVEAYEAGWQLRDIVALVQMDLKTFKVACELVGINVTASPSRQRLANLPDTDPTQAAPLKLMPKPGVASKPKADYPDAVAVWNEIGPIGRPRLKKELEARGLECSDDLAKKLLAMIAADLEKQAGVGGGVAVGGGE